MGAIDTFNKFTGGPSDILGNVGGGTSYAITPALESLSSEGLIKKAMDLFGKIWGIGPAQAKRWVDLVCYFKKKNINFYGL